MKKRSRAGFGAVLLLILTVVCALTGVNCRLMNRERRNVILISIDTLRADHVGCYGYDKPTTPRIDALAAEGIVFRNAYATSPWTLPSHTSMFTGLYADAHGMNDGKSVLAKKATTLASIMKNHGFWTGAIVCAPYLDKHYGLTHGFDVYDNDLVHPKVKNPRAIKVADDVTDKALAYIDRHKRKNIFLFLHYWDPHHPYNPAKEYVDLFDPDYTGQIKGFNIRLRKDMVPGMNPRDLEHIVALYDGEIRYTDDGIGRLLDGLARRGLDKNTMIVITSDHGEEFLEHGGRAHLAMCWEELIRVPMIFYVPWLTPHAKAFDELVSLVDLFPTILDFNDIGRSDYRVQGRSLAWLIQRGTPLEDRNLYAETRFGNLTPMRHDPRGIWSVLIDPERMKFHSFVRPREQINFLFDLTVDPGERENLVNLRRETMAELNRQLKKQQSIHQHLRDELNWTKRRKASRKIRNKLKNLGYI